MVGIRPVLASLELTRNPFPPTPDAGSYFLTSRLHEQFSDVMHCIEARKGFVLLTGEVGLGKSTLVRRLLAALPVETTRSALILNTFLQEAHLLAAILRDFGVMASGAFDGDLALLNNFLLRQYQEGKTCLLVIDDAQNLNVESLEMVRLFCNLETDQEKLLQILLVGQPELEKILENPALRQLKSRIVKHARLQGLRLDEVLRYFDFRVTAAGGTGRINLTPEATRQLHKFTGGNLRKIHLVLDRCLYGLVSLRTREIDKALLMLAVKDVSEKQAPRHFWHALWLTPLVFTGIGALAVFLGTGSNPLSDSVFSRSMPVRTIVGPVTTLAALPVPHSLVKHDGANECLQKIRAGDPGQFIVSQLLPPTIAKKLKETPGICMFSHEMRTWVTWLADTRSADALLPQPSEATRQMQRRLVRFGVLAPDLVDGVNGEKTTVAIRAFQRLIALPVSGRPDELTYMLLEKLDAS